MVYGKIDTKSKALRRTKTPIIRLPPALYLEGKTGGICERTTRSEGGDCEGGLYITQRR